MQALGGEGMARIVLAEPQAIVREGLRLILGQHSEWDIVGEAENGQSAVEMARRLRPDVLVTEAFLPGLSGLEATAELAREAPSVRVLILSARRGGQLVQSALKSGARGYVTKSSSPKELIKAVELLLEGGNYLSPDIMPHVVDALTGRGATCESGLSALTHRERQILQLIAEGMSSKEIADSVSVSPRTVESYRAALMQKLGIRKVSALVRFAIREGLVDA